MIIKNLTPEMAVKAWHARDKLDGARAIMRELIQDMNSTPARGQFDENVRLFDVERQINLAIAALDMGLRGNDNPL